MGSSGVGAPGRRRRASWGLASAILLAACGEAQGPSYYFFPEGPFQSVEIPEPASGSAADAPWSAGPELVLEEVGSIFVARVFSDTLVGIVDPMACQGHLYGLDPEGHALRHLARLGRCGDGPAEFRGLVDLHAHGDTLILADEQRNTLSFFPVQGGEPRRLQLGSGLDDPWRVSEIVHVEESSLLLLGTLRAGAEPQAGFVRRVHRTTGAVLDAFLPDPSAAALNLAAGLRRGFLCRDPAGGELVVANRWRAERAVLDEGGRVRAVSISPSLEWVAEEPWPDRPGVRPTAYVRLACGGGEALIQWRTQDSNREVDRYYLEILNVEGRVLHQETGGRPGPQHPAAMGIAGRVPGGWLAYSNHSELGPILRVLRLQGADSPG